jgi:AcrR family transcriptional regulator
MTQQRPLRERKRQRAEQAIIDAAYALFAERGFADVTVTEIAERAEVGRTTFFRYFGDKQEVLFAGEERVLDQLTPQHAPREAPTFQQTLTLARAAVRATCETVITDPERYRLREQLIADNGELHDRNERKILSLTQALARTLWAQGTPAREALVAAHLAIACYRAGKSLAGTNPAALTAAVDTAFNLLEQAVPSPAPSGDT